MTDSLKEFVFSHPGLIGCALRVYNRLHLGNRLSVCRGKLICRLALLSNVRIKSEGKNNRIVIGDYSQLRDCTFYFHGDDNVVEIGSRCDLQSADFYLEDKGNCIRLGDHCSVSGKTQFAAIEGTHIEIGKDCMFSSDINVRTGDAHSILDGTGKRINPSADLSIGDHCWIGMRAIILKGVRIGRDSIVSAAAVVSRTPGEDGVILAGVPARVVRRNISWLRERIEEFADQD